MSVNMYPRALLRPTLRAISVTRPACCRTFIIRTRPEPTDRLSEHLNINELARRRDAYNRDRRVFLITGVIAGVIGIGYTSYKLKTAIDKQAEAREGKMDSNVPTEMFTVEGGTKRKVVLHDSEGHEIVPTGNSAVPTFPRTIDVPLPTTSASTSEQPIEIQLQKKEGTEYTLVGLGLRSVSFLGIQVYVVGFYVATSDIATLQEYLTKKVNKLATTLVPSEKEELRKMLMDPVEGEVTWNAILKESGCRSAFRLTPVRNTDFPHLRDAFIRAITTRSKGNDAFNDEAFGQSTRAFKQMFNRGKAPKGSEILLCRDSDGQLAGMYDEGKPTGRITMGIIKDERVSRLLWLNYLAGSKVASEPARENIISGVMEFVERPIGTVAAQVV